MQKRRLAAATLGRALAILWLAAPLVTAKPGGGAVLGQPIVWHLDNLEKIGGHSVTAIGTPTVVATEAGSAMEFDGATDGLLLAVNPIEGLAQFTVEALFQPSAEGVEEQRFLHVSETGSDRRLMLETRLLPDRTWALDTYLRSEPPGLTLLDRGRSHASGSWHTVALTYDGRTMTSYVDGERELSGEVAFARLGEGQTSIGVRQNRVSWFAGRIRLLRFSAEVLSPERLLVPEGALVSPVGVR